MKHRIHAFVVRIKVDAARKDAEIYIRDAVKDMGGCHPPDSPFFNLSDYSVSVKPIRLLG
jgi:hypothetical protein